MKNSKHIMFVISFCFAILISHATNCAGNENVSAPSSSEESDYEHFKTLATQSHGGLGSAYVRHEMEKHGSWYHRKRHDRTKIFQSSKLQTTVNGKPNAPFNVHDITEDYRDQMLRIGVGIAMLKNAANYSDAAHTKAADAAVYLNLKLRPSKSEVIPKYKSTKTEIENMLKANGTTVYLESVRRINPDNFKNLTSHQIGEIQSIKNGSVLSKNITSLSANLTKPVLLNDTKMGDFKPVPLLIRSINFGLSLHHASPLLLTILLLTTI